MARVGHSVAVGPSAVQALSAAFHISGKASERALLADLSLLAPSVAVAELERSIRTA